MQSLRHSLVVHAALGGVRYLRLSCALAQVQQQNVTEFVLCTRTPSLHDHTGARLRVSWPAQPRWPY